ncbi:MAG: DUF1801 domain-containing protein [Acidobacteriota bacterium]|nr:DUF1801 domain-containing protein [Acidobacteriota bacterium]
MAELKTKQTEASVEEFFSGIADENARRDSLRIAELMEKATGEKPKMWGESIVGFGSQRLKYDSGRELDWMVIGLSPRKANITLYLSNGAEWNEDLLSRLGKHKTGKGCLYIKRLTDVDENVLRQLIEQSVKETGKK